MLAAMAATVALVAGPLRAQEGPPRDSGAPAAAASRLVAGAVEGTIRVDGILREPVWSTADSISDFRQREPASGAEATERTVVRVAYDADALYVAVRADEPADDVRATQFRRDADLTADDNVTILIDSFHERRGAFLFRTNPVGAMWDAQLSGWDRTNENWDGIWDLAVHRDSAGWTAELRIPFRTLRFRPGPSRVFGLNVRRFLARRNEEDLWRSYGRTQGLTDLLEEGDLVGLGTLSRGLDLEARPYALGRVDQSEHDSAGRRLVGGGVDAKIGLDAKLAPLPTLTADLTVNTDFAQVEADQQVINLTRFPLFLPEKREFFLESSSIFDFGTSERAQLFYSRRIGLDTAGVPVPILGGARVYGKVGPWTVGGLDVRTGGSENANDLVLRIKHDLFARSTIGLMAVNRSGPGVTGSERALGFDMDFPIVVGGQNLEPSFWLAATRVPGVPGTPTAWRYGTDFPNDLFDNFFSVYHIGAGFDPTLGFVRRAGIWESTGHIDFMPRPHLLGIRRLDIKFPIPSWDILADTTGSLTRSAGWQTARFEWRLLGGDFESGARFEVNLQRELDAPAEPFEIFPGVEIAPGRYWWTRWELQYETSPAHPVSAWTQLSWGGFYGGHSTDISVHGRWQGGGHLTLGTDLARTSVRLPAGSFTALQLGARLDYAFTTRSDFLLYAQYDNEDRRAGFDLRFHWIPRIGDDVFVVWNSSYTTDPAARYRFPNPSTLARPLNGALIVKVVHRLAF